MDKGIPTICLLITYSNFGHLNSVKDGVKENCGTQKSNVIPLKARRVPYDSRLLRLPEFLDSRHMKVLGFQSHSPAAFTPQEISLVDYSFLLDAESTPGP
jgi:hypothetical protein